MRHFRFFLFFFFKAIFENSVWHFVIHRLLAGNSLAQGRTHLLRGKTNKAKQNTTQAEELQAGGVTGDPHGQSSPTTLKQQDLPLLPPAITATTSLLNLLALLSIPKTP